MVSIGKALAACGWTARVLASSTIVCLATCIGSTVVNSMVGRAAAKVSAMRLAVSNLAWGRDELDKHLRLLEELDCEGVELVAGRIWPEPVASTPAQRRELREAVASRNLAVVGLHSLLSTRPDLALFESPRQRSALIEYLKSVADLCADLGGQTMVFGSVRARRRADTPYASALEVAADAFRDVAAYAAERQVVLCIEPLGSTETDFINRSEEGMDLVRRVAHPNFRLHLDAKAMMAAGEDYEAAIGHNIDDLWHFHVADPGLAPPGSSRADHAPIASALRVARYPRWVSIEMRRGFGPTAEVIERSLEFVRRTYLDLA